VRIPLMEAPYSRKPVRGDSFRQTTLTCYRLPMDCLTCEQLIAEFEQAETRFAMACDYFEKHSGSTNRELFDTIKHDADKAEIERDVARIELERHQRTHPTG
jgi:hypothetical protein